MSTKKIILTSSGLQNIVLTKYQDDRDFIFVFGDQEILIKSFFAEFISPFVSRLHKTDPTIHTVNFGHFNKIKDREFKEFSKTAITPEIISLFKQISSGHSIEINLEQAIKLRFISILIGYEELNNKLNENFPPKYSEENVNSYLKNIECCYNFSQLKLEFDIGSLISFVSSHFDMLNRDEFMKLPRQIQYEIISNQNLRIESEDSLFDIISEIIESEKGNEEVSNVMFLEQIEFTELSEDKLHLFVDFFDTNVMSGSLWNKLSKCFFSHNERKCKPSSSIIIVGGHDNYNQLVEKPNNRECINPPLIMSLDSSSLLSYSVYDGHAIAVTKNGSLLGIGKNFDGRISSSIMKEKISQLTEFSIKDLNDSQLSPISAFCSGLSSLYLFAKSGSRGGQLVYCDCKINEGDPIFLDIGDAEPLSLFGDFSHSAAISDTGKVIFINRYTVKKSPNSRIDAVSLPCGEKATCIACLKDSIFVLSSKGRVFSSLINIESNIHKLSLV